MVSLTRLIAALPIISALVFPTGGDDNTTSFSAMILPREDDGDNANFSIVERGRSWDHPYECRSSYKFFYTRYNLYGRNWYTNEIQIYDDIAGTEACVLTGWVWEQRQPIVYDENAIVDKEGRKWDFHVSVSDQASAFAGFSG
ncbi:hypothetical protein Q7P37_004808 [Cladosporium fusiforme]